MATPHRSMVFWELPLEKGLHEGAIHPVAVLFVLHYPTNIEFPVKLKLSFRCVISGFCYKADENCALLVYSTARRLCNNPEECNSFVFSLFQTKVFCQFVTMNLTGFVYELMSYSEASSYVQCTIQCVTICT